MPRPKNCKLCGQPLKNKKPTALYCNTYHRLIASKLKRGIITLPYALSLMNKHEIMRTKISQKEDIG
jgi:hypothetical protein